MKSNRDGWQSTKDKKYDNTSKKENKNYAVTLSRL